MSDGQSMIRAPIIAAGFALLLLFIACGDEEPTRPPTPRCATPTIEPASGTYTAPIRLTIECATDGATIRYSADGSDPAETSLVYLQPISISADAVIKARAWKEGHIPSEIASASFHFSLCSLAVESPNGGETLTEGEVDTIRWTGTICPGAIRIELLRDGAACDTLAVAAPNVGAFEWTVRGCGGRFDGYAIRLTETLSGAFDESDEPFSIAAPCVVEIVAPAGGETWTEGSLQAILWNAAGDCRDGVVIIDLLRDDLPCRRIAENASGGRFDWTVAGCPDAGAGYRVRVTDLASGASALSPSEFQIAASPCAIGLTSPAGGEFWQEGSERTIAWSASGCGDFMRIDLLLDGAVCETIEASTANDGAYSWIVRRCAPAQGGYAIRMTDLTSGVSADSPAPFSITAAPPCLITVAEPNGAESWQAGTTHEIRWTSASCGATVRIELLRHGSQCRLIDAAAANDGSYEWTVEGCSGEQGAYAILVTDPPSGASDESDAPFSIPPAPCAVSVLSPNGGESWEEGTPREILWDSRSCSPTVRVELLRDGAPCSVLSEQTENNGSFPWMAAQCGDDEPGYRIRIVDPQTGEHDESDGTFAIPPAPPCKPIVTSPAGGETWIEGTPGTIRWSPGSCDASVRIELLAEGIPCAEIAASTENDGAHDWIPQRCLDRESGYRVRVTGLQSGESGSSGWDFTIAGPCEIEVTSPAGGARWQEGGVREIAWTTTGACAMTVRVDLLLDGAACVTIAEATENDGALAWAAVRCGEAEEGYRIRVTDGGGQVAGESDPFTIEACRIQVTSPADGQEWREGTGGLIAWTSSGCGETVRVELLREGSVCRTLSDGTENDGALDWIAENCAGEESGYAIRVTDLQSGASAESQGTFMIPECRVVVTYPNGGELLPRDSEQTIAWTSSRCGGSVRIDLICAGVVCATLSSATENDGQFPWTAGSCCDDPCGYRIRVTDIEYGVGDESDSGFCVCPPCEVLVTSPNGGEIWKEGTIREIVWTSVDCASTVRIELLRDGAYCRTVVDGTPDDGRHAWQVQNCGPAGGYAIRVIGPCGTQDTSDGSFTIPECVLEILSPNGGERWEPGEARTIEWRSTECGGEVRIDLLIDGAPCRTIAASAPNTGSFPWTAEPCASSGCAYRIRLTDLETSKVDESNSPFCVCPPCGASVLEPNGGEIWEEGAEQEIRWSLSGQCDQSVRIELVRAGSVCATIASSTPNDGSLLWIPSRCLLQTTDYRVRVTGLACQQTDESDLPFSIPPPPCRIALASPDGGERWTSGASHEIRWDWSGDCGGTVRVDLYRNGSPCQPIAASTANDGLLQWTASRCAAGADGYAVRVEELSSGAFDQSEAAFSIPDCSIDVTSPDGGEVWTEGTARTITWTSSDCTGLVRIELYRGGSACATLAQSAPDDGSFPWTASNCADLETGYSIRVTDIETGVAGQSAADFAIPQPPCQLSVTAPNGGERWAEGSPQTIRWTSAHCGATVRIELLRGGVVCRTLSAATGNTGSFPWTPQRCGNEIGGYAVRVTDVGSGVQDQSDSSFEIPCAPCAIAVTSPSGGESWQEGSERTIAWAPAACDQAVRIELLQNDAVCSVIAESTPDDGSHPWTALRCGASASGYKIRVTQLVCGGSASSAATFSIPPIPDLYYIPAGLEICRGARGVEIPIYGRNSQAIKGYGIHLSFDPAVFECVDITDAGTRGAGGTSFARLCGEGSASAGVIYSASCPPSIAAGEGVMMKLIVNVKADAPLGPTVLDLSDADPSYNTMTRCGGGGVDPALQDGAIEVCAARPGSMPAREEGP